MGVQKLLDNDILENDADCSHGMTSEGKEAWA